jgi:hypothetical protein
MKSLAVKKIDADKIRKDIKEITGRLREIKGEVDSKLVRLTNLVLTVRDKKLYREWKDPSTRRPFTSFDSWLRNDIEESRASVYRFIAVREHLGDISDKTLEGIGSTKCFELVKIAREKPALLGKFVKELESNPETPLYTLQQQVTNTLAGSHLDSGKYERWEFAVRTEDAPYIVKALAVMQAMGAVDNPETAAGRGQHLVVMCQEYLTERGPAMVLKTLEKSGAFSNTPFEVEG